MRLTHFTLPALLLCAAAPLAAQSATSLAPPSASPQPQTNLARFEPEILAFETSDRASPVAPAGILFVGSSSIRFWRSLATDFPGLPVLNRGFGGSTMPEVNHYISRIVLPYRPREIVLYAGDNDLAAGRTPAQVAADYRDFVRTVRAALPTTRIVYLSVKPSPSRWALADKMRETNRLVRAITATDSLQSFVDVFTPMLGADGRPRAELFIGDSLHMTPRGYAVWRETVAPTVH